MADLKGGLMQRRRGGGGSATKAEASGGAGPADEPADLFDDEVRTAYIPVTHPPPPFC